MLGLKLITIKARVLEASFDHLMEIKRHGLSMKSSGHWPVRILCLVLMLLMMCRTGWYCPVAPGSR